MKKLITLLILISLTQACTVTPHNGVKPYFPTINTKTLSLSKEGLHIPNIIYPLEIDDYGIPLYIDTGSLSLEEFLCVLDPSC